MIRTCPVCNRDFESVIANATYCTVSCRKKAGREKEKEKQSAFYVPPKLTEDHVLFSLVRPTLDEVVKWADILERFVRAANKDRCVLVYGMMPDGWRDTQHIFAGEVQGANPRYWTMVTDGLVHSTVKKPLPLLPQKREVLLSAMEQEAAEVERRVMEEE